MVINFLKKIVIIHLSKKNYKNMHCKHSLAGLGSVSFTSAKQSEYLHNNAEMGKIQ